jgi:hypothetical protein
MVLMRANVEARIYFGIVLLDYPHERLVSLCTQHRQLVFPPQ